MNNKLSILHINARSVISTEKKLAINHLISTHNPDFFSINETYLKPTHDFEIEGYSIYRHDRLTRRGGGTALAVRKNIKGNIIFFSEVVLNEYAVGFQAETSHGEILIVSLYIVPSNESLNLNLLNSLMKFKNIIITGDLNAKSKLWHCKTDNKRGLELETEITRLDLHVLNNRKPTYPSSKNILDLSICSNSMRNKFTNFQVLDDKLSDHQPTLTSFKISIDKFTFEINKIDHERLIINLENLCPNLKITDKNSLDSAVHQLDCAFKLALSNSTTKHIITKPNKNSSEVPKHILELIKAKRKARRNLSINSSPENRTIFNKLNRQVKSVLKKFRQQLIETKFKELKSFNQSSSKHWKIIKSLQSNSKSSPTPITLHDKNTPYHTNQAISEKFASILSNTFGVSNHLKDLPKYNISSEQQTLTITQKEYDFAIESCNKKSAPGWDLK